MGVRVEWRGLLFLRRDGIRSAGNTWSKQQYDRGRLSYRDMIRFWFMSGIKLLCTETHTGTRPTLIPAL